MAVKHRTPMRPVPWPPRDPAPRASYTYAVHGSWKSGVRETFKRIAQAHGITDVWDLIYYNFRVGNPDEVNYSLNRYLGCTKTLDGFNYCLDPRDASPTVYIPPVGFKGERAVDVTARNLILTTLGSAAMDQIRFRLGDIIVHRKMFARVEELMRSKSILAIGMTRAEAPNIRALYNMTMNTIQVRDPGENTMLKRAVIAHESLHAGMDAELVPGLVLDHEAAAHVAEALYICASTVDPLRTIRPAEMSGTAPAHARAAMVLALRIYEHGTRSKLTLSIPQDDAQLAALRESLLLVSEYRTRAGLSIGSNGV
ncbi:hypothetical protein [Muricoccus radiodurans]|uniref:hypothetical protein n=1 Tax=Muricoccus radiodurans TaxID=2231721 RepID=UPI003CEFF78A